MSLHRSLKTKPSALNQHRNVLTRAERIGKLTETEKFFKDKTSPVGLPKVANRLVATAKKPKKEAAAEGAEGAAAAVPGAPAAAALAAGATAKAAPAKAAPAKPAAGAKK